MNRQELAEYSQRELRRQLRSVVIATVFCVVWTVTLLWAARSLDWMGATLQSVAILVAGAAVPVVVLLRLAIGLFRRAPRCPTCGIRFFQPLLATAISTGICGHCGRSVES